jgi:hypothetical protein
MSDPSLERAIEVTGALALRIDLLTVTCAGPLPPGSRVRFELARPGTAAALALSGKVAGLERHPAGGYLIRLRLHGLSRADRTALEELVRAG